MNERACFKYTNKGLLLNIKKLAKKLGRNPFRREIDASGGPSSWVYYQRFGTLRNVFEKAGLNYKLNRITRKEAIKE